MNKLWVASRGWVWFMLKLAAVLSLVVAVVYWVKFSPIAVSEHLIQRGLIVAEVMGTGTLEARIEATVGPKISGRVKNVLFDQGDRVSKGDLLIELDDEELQQQVAIADANVGASRAAIERLATDKDRATAVYTQARKSYSRTQTLIARSAVSQEELDRSTEALAVAVTGVSRAEAAITEGQKELVAVEKTLEYHRTRLDDSRIYAPFDGLIVSRNRELGDVVVPGSLILRLISTKQLWVSTWVDETEMARLAPDQRARIVFRSESATSYPGKVVRLGREVDRETREFIVDVDVLQLPTNWAVGQRADAFIEVARKEGVVLLVSNLIVRREGQAGVFVKVADHAVWRPLTLGLRNRDAVEVLTGLQPADVVVTPVDAQTLLSEGRKVVTP